MPPRAGQQQEQAPAKAGGNGRNGRKAPDPTPGERKVVYPKVELRIADGPDAITVEQARSLLGWCEDETTARRHGVPEPHLTDFGPARLKVWLLNNVTNRPIYPELYKAYGQEILNRRWSGPNGNGKSVNGENIIIGKTALVLNGQHTLIGLNLAEAERTGEKGKHHWVELWPGPCVIDKTIALGIDEDDVVVNTMDTCKPRSFGDVIYRSEFFKDVTPPLTSSALSALSRLLEGAVKQMWVATGADKNPWASKRTHSEGLDFIKRHHRLLEAVRFVHSENSGGAVAKVCGSISPGRAAALLYVMGTCESDGDAYRAGDPPREELLDFSLWDKAKEFWALLSAESRKVFGVKQGLAWLADPDGDGTRYSPPDSEEEIAVVVKGWLAFSKRGKVELDDVKLDYVTKEHVVRGEEEGQADVVMTEYVLNEEVTAGGVDQGIQSRNKPEPPPPEPKDEAPARPKKTPPVAGGKPPVKTPSELQEELRAKEAEHPGRLLMFKTDSSVIVYDAHAKDAAKILGKKPAKDNASGMQRFTMPVGELEQALVTLVGNGKQVAVLTMTKGEDGKVQVGHEYFPKPDRVEGQSGSPAEQPKRLPKKAPKK